MMESLVCHVKKFGLFFLLGAIGKGLLVGVEGEEYGQLFV